MTNPTQFEQCVAELRELVGQHILPSYLWYQNNSKGPRNYFRISGVVVVVGSLLLPVISTFENLPLKQLILAAVSVLVAILSSLSTFYRWDSAWQSRMKAAMELHGLLAKWELNLTAAKMGKDPTKEALTATKELFDEAFRLIGAETGQFFANVKPPSISTAH